ncbi:MAG: HD domain-containing phosphohydrolase [Nitrospirota bacterium]|nr:HD domain-containing phosphohydrolase [Nitrospirota bacterium]
MISNNIIPARDTASVLIVDDLQSDTELIEAVFKSDDFRIFKSANPVEAVDIFETCHPDIAIIDITMHDVNGFQLCQIFKDMAGRRFFPVVLLAAHSDRGSKIKGFESGADDFISRPFDSREFLARIRSLLRLKHLHDELEHSENIILTLAATLEVRDPHTQGHSTRVGAFSKEFGDYLGLSLQEQELLRKAGLLHDIGKIGLSKDLFLKPPPLTDEEMETIKKHTIIGEQICKPLHSLREVLPAIRHHHERWDGNGFPDGLKGEDIPLLARVLSIVDSFDAMFSERLYREGRTAFEVLEVMREEKHLGQWDPVLLEHFIEMMNLTGHELLGHGAGTDLRPDEQKETLLL